MYVHVVGFIIDEIDSTTTQWHISTPNKKPSHAPDVADPILAHHVPRRPAGSGGGCSRGRGLGVVVVMAVVVVVVVVAAGPVLVMVVVPAWSGSSVCVEGQSIGSQSPSIQPIQSTIQS